MENLEILIDNKPRIIGASKGLLDIDGATFIVTQEADHVIGWTIAEIIIRPKKKYIGVVWQKLRFETTELRQLSDYYNPVTKRPLFVEDRSMEGKEAISDQNSFQEVAPGVFWYSYDAFYDMPAAKSGDNLCGIALAKFCELHLKFGNVLKYTPTGLEFQQPVNFNLSFQPRTSETDAYRVTVLPVDGVAPFEFSVDGIEYEAIAELTYAGAEGHSVYVRDAAGTVSKKALSDADWPVIVEAPV